MGLMTEPTRILDSSVIDWDVMTDGEKELISSNCCICGKEITTYKAFDGDAICSRKCANRAQRGL